MTAYRLWHGWQPRPTVVEAVILDCDSWFLGVGTDALIDDVQDAIGVRAPRLGWQLTPARNNYYAPHRAARRSWGDVWNVAWFLSIEWAAAVTARFDRRGDSVGIDSVDASHRDGSPYDWEAIGCVAIGDFVDDDAAARADEALAADGLVARPGLAFGRYPQRLIELGSRPRDFYVDGAGEAEAIVARLDALGASTNLITTEAWVRRERSRR